MMSRRTYVMVARRVNQALRESETRDEQAGIRSLAGFLALDFAEDNPRFDRRRFMAACEQGVPNRQEHAVHA